MKMGLGGRLEMVGVSKADFLNNFLKEKGLFEGPSWSWSLQVASKRPYTTRSGDQLYESLSRRPLLLNEFSEGEGLWRVSRASTL